jgi:hypothetical protein
MSDKSTPTNSGSILQIREEDGNHRYMWRSDGDDMWCIFRPPLRTFVKVGEDNPLPPQHWTLPDNQKWDPALPPIDSQLFPEVTNGPCTVEPHREKESTSFFTVGDDHEPISFPEQRVGPSLGGNTYRINYQTQTITQDMLDEMIANGRNVTTVAPQPDDKEEDIALEI